MGTIFGRQPCSVRPSVCPKPHTAFRDPRLTPHFGGLPPEISILIWPPSVSSLASLFYLSVGVTLTFQATSPHPAWEIEPRTCPL